MHKKRIAMAMMGLMLVGGLCNVGTITSHAEDMAGYHEYVNTEDEAIDTLVSLMAKQGNLNDQDVYKQGI